MTAVENIEIAPGYRISRLIKGGWQLAGGHGPVERECAIEDMFAFVDAGVTSFDCADIYTGVEELIGEFLQRYQQRHGAEASRRIKIHTKYVPDYNDLATLGKRDVNRIIDRSLRRLQLERLDMVQFGWWTYEIPRYVETALWLQELKQAGKIDLIGSANFDTVHMAQMIDAGVEIAINQVQYSLLDHRPERSMLEICAERDIKLLCYGVLAGGFFSEAWLGQAEPSALENRSLIKYKLIIDDFGGWALFQALLRTLKTIADKHQVSIANIATRYLLDRPQVGAAIVGARYAHHLTDNLRVFSLMLDTVDLAMIDKILQQRSGPSGEVNELERDKQGRHGRIMKYNLNQGRD